jgi:hypothetical protein
MKWLHRLKPTDSQIEELARHETDPRHVRDYTPRAYGPLPTVLACAGVVLLYLPLILVHALRRLLTRRKKAA